MRLAPALDGFDAGSIFKVDKVSDVVTMMVLGKSGAETIVSTSIFLRKGPSTPRGEIKHSHILAGPPIA